MEEAYTQENNTSASVFEHMDNPLDDEDFLDIFSTDYERLDIFTVEKFLKGDYDVRTDSQEKWFMYGVELVTEEYDNNIPYELRPIVEDSIQDSYETTFFDEEQEMIKRTEVEEEPLVAKEQSLETEEVELKQPETKRTDELIDQILRSLLQ